MNDEKRDALALATMIMLDRAGGEVEFTPAEWQKVKDKYGGRPAIILTEIDKNKAPAFPKKLRIASRVEAEQWTIEQDHLQMGHMRCECGAWIKPAPNGWVHVYPVDDAKPLHMAMPA